MSVPKIQCQKIHDRSVLVAAFRPNKLTKGKAGCHAGYDRSPRVGRLL